MAEMPKMRMSQWSVGSGYVQLSWPDPLTPEDLEDLEAFIAITMKGIKRRAAKADAQGADPLGLKPDAEAERETPHDNTTGDPFANRSVAALLEPGP
jgi:hypothetical protein